MPLGYDKEPRLYNLGDTAELNGSIYNDDGDKYTGDDLLAVQFVVRKPDGTQTTLDGTIDDEGDASGIYTDTNVIGDYQTLARFTTVYGNLKSSRSDFQVQDPFEEDVPQAQKDFVRAVWRKFQDCFDSEEGGPWLRDETLASFDPQDVLDFVPEAMLLINSTQPITEFDVPFFTNIQTNGDPNPNEQFLVAFTYIAMIRHLMRSYVEQPDLQGAQVVYENRRDYLQRWQLLYQMEFDYWNRLLMLWKRQFLGLGQSALLVTSKAGRLLGPGMKNRMLNRGWWY